MTERTIHDIAFRGHTDLLREVLTKENVNKRDGVKNTPLHWAAYIGSIATIKLLIGAGADLEALNNHGETPADRARSRRQSKAAELLETSGLN